MVRWTYINAIGGTTISALTLISASYLLISLWRQGRGKLRVRLLLGMVISDVILGLVAIVPESIYLTDGIGLRTGSRGCAFLLTCILFTQHLWTLAIAAATFLLLKHPLSKTTSSMEAWSWLAAPVIWAISLLHSGLWWIFVGFENASGNLCYYGAHPIPAANDLDARDLVQFIPRAFVFIFIVTLYSTLFNFLRRPDTIQLSSQFVSGGTNSDQQGPSHISKVLRRLANNSQKRAAPAANPDAPWEQMEFVQIGHGNTWGLSPVQPQASFFNPSYNPTGSESLLQSRPETPKLDLERSDTADFPEPNRGFSRTVSTSTEGFTSPGTSQRPSETETFVTSNNGDAPDMGKDRPLSPVMSTRETLDTKSMDLQLGGETRRNEERRASGQTLKEFFQENQARGPEDEGRADGTGTNGKGVQLSATAYFNRQASLLMLYFPLAYMVVFSVSLVRLIYGMVNKKPSPVLTLMSSWMVLSVGLIDGLVYGVAEFLVRRRVRRKMPEHMGSR